MTKETIKKETTEIIKRIEALESIPASVHDFSRNVIIGTMLKEYKDRYEYLNMSKEYMVHFEGGGWNTCYGCDEEAALESAKEMFEPGITVQSVSLASAEAIAVAMRLFY